MVVSFGLSYSEYVMRECNETIFTLFCHSLLMRAGNVEYGSVWVTVESSVFTIQVKLFKFNFIPNNKDCKCCTEVAGFTLGIKVC